MRTAKIMSFSSYSLLYQPKKKFVLPPAGRRRWWSRQSLLLQRDRHSIKTCPTTRSDTERCPDIVISNGVDPLIRLGNIQPPRSEKNVRHNKRVVLLAKHGKWLLQLCGTVPIVLAILTLPTHQRLLQLVPPEGFLETVAVDILGLLPNTRTGNEYVVLMIDRYLKFTRAIPTTAMTKKKVPQFILDNYFISYDIPEKPLMENGPQIVWKNFNGARAASGSRWVTTVFYHSQTNGQTKTYNRKIVSRLRRYIGKNQNDGTRSFNPEPTHITHRLIQLRIRLHSVSCWCESLQ